ncbi:MAG TPA: argininosuccinate lyase [Candidatus Borkfalkia excrementigallinarum]|uniref:Argininosuccinate lyase n=1 Tax=Candidatus Borkfalkia excrementigallinarum TaxID=2838506 RepID=A0A9D2CSB7_9FIRM|nr:argininosuccinate lyase [Candidatus Borkfalkia excrementigallinarum]
MKMWEGRFTQPSAKSADEFNQSLSFDYKLYWHDILASIAHVKMLGETQIISKEDADKISDALVNMLADIEKGNLEIEGAEDIHTFVEDELTKRIGIMGKKLHTARSRNDQVATDMRLYTKDSIVNICGNLKVLVGTLVDIATNNIQFIMPGYTHMRRAQPISVAQYFNAYSEMFLRDIERFTDCYKRTDVMPLGSCALAGTDLPIDRRMTASLLSFSEISQNALDAVSDRDFVAEYLFCCSTLMAHLSRFCEDLILYSSEEFGFIDIADAYSTGSSIMPQKKNPDIPELIRGKTGRVYGYLMGILTTIKGLPLTYNKDLQEDKEALFNAEETVLSCVGIFNELLQNISFDTKKMRSAAAGGFSTATDVADYLVQKGMAFRDAHAVTANIVRYCIENNKTLDKLDLFVYQSFSSLFDEEILSRVRANKSVEARKVIGGSARSAVRENIRSINKRLNKMFKE